jgi:hypothetical protein
MAENKYDNCVVTLPFHKAGNQSLMSVGARELNGFNCTIIYAFAFQTGITGLSRKPHVHNYDEAIFFLGSNPRDISNLGAEVEFDIGAEEEKHVFNTPSAIVVPKGLPHCPIVTKKIDQPYLCMAVSLTGIRTD